MDSSMPNWFKWLLSSVATVFTYVFGEGDDWLIALIIFVVIDYLTGVMAAAYEKKLDSSVGFKGLLRKVSLLAVIAVANLVDKSMNLSGAVRTVIICFFCANEGLSILENCAKMGLPIPKKLIDVLAQLKAKGLNTEKEGDSNVSNTK